MFFTVGRNQPVLKVTDLECTNSAKSNCQWDSQEREIVQSVCGCQGWFSRGCSGLESGP